MARIELRDIAHSYHASPASEREYALKPLDQVWESGGAYALLGPSGCGKSTLLNIMSGLVLPSRGSILIDGRDVTALAPQERNIAQVFQFPVIYDTMTVFDNLAFPLRNRGQRGPELNKRVERVAELLELTTSLKRKARQLSADMKQRISLGRGLVRTDVAAILLDEPLTVIDPHSKWLLRRKLKQIHAELAVTLVYVTHDQIEALTLADQVLVMQDGSVLQRGTPQQLFEAPAHTFVGYFIGSPGMNLLRCELSDGGVSVDGQQLPLDAALCARARERGGPFALGVRPEHLRLAAADGSTTAAVGFDMGREQADADAAPMGSLAAQVERVEQLGHASLVTARVGSQTAIVKLRDAQAPSPGAAIRLELPSTWSHLYAAERLIE
jgi:glycerol transport system ATP-binding protein